MKKTMLMMAIFSLLFTGCVQMDGLKNPFEQKVYKSDKEVLMFVLDSSGSMNNTDRNGLVKMDAAKSVLKDIALKLDSSKINAGLINFSSGCYSSELLVEPNNNDFNKIIKTSSNISASGKTPLAQSIRKAGYILKNIDKKVNIIIISDGQETCGGDPVYEAKNLYSKYGINANIYVIGYAVDEVTKRQLVRLSNVGNGGYFDAKDAYKLNDVIDQITDKLNIKSENWKGGVYKFKINFDSGSSKVKNKYKKQIKNLSDYLEKNNYSLEIQGHTDSQGKKTYNQKLSKKRANAVVDKLIKNGLSKSRVYGIGYGELAPIDSNDNRDGRYNNRRVEAHIIKGNGLNIDLINKSNNSNPINVRKASINSFVGYYKIIDPKRTYKQYHAYLKIYANNSAKSSEFLNKKAFKDDFYWSFNNKTSSFTYGSKTGGKMSGKIVGNTNNFRLSGYWSNKQNGKLDIQRISKNELDCMENNGSYKKSKCSYNY